MKEVIFKEKLKELEELKKLEPIDRVNEYIKKNIWL